jgi:hypothetical protein
MKIAPLYTIIITAMLSLPAHALVKKSDSGFCHDERSSYFTRTKTFTAYGSVQECLASGGRLPKGAISKPSASLDDYSRDKFGHGWSDIDHDGQDTRQEVLIAQNTGNLVVNEKGRVIRGRWVSMYSGKIIVDASQVDIDHIVPLSWAWKHGADKWNQNKREQFANDERNLVAVEASLNRQKGDKGLDEWLPPKNQTQYKARFQRITTIYGLN